MSMIKNDYESPQLEVLLMEVESPIFETSNKVVGPGDELPD